MLMYTCVPPEMIMGLQDEAEYEIIKINHGCVKAAKTPDGLVVSSLAVHRPDGLSQSVFYAGVFHCAAAKAAGDAGLFLRGVLCLSDRMCAASPKRRGILADGQDF